MVCGGQKWSDSVSPVLKKKSSDAIALSWKSRHRTPVVIEPCRPSEVKSPEFPTVKTTLFIISRGPRLRSSNKSPEPTPRPAGIFARSVVFGVVAGAAHL